MSDEKVLATIDGVQITDKDVDEYIMKMPEEQRQYATDDYFRGQVLQQMINSALLFKLAEEKNLEDTDEFRNIMANIRKEVLAQLAVASIVDEIKVTEPEVKEFYDTHGDMYVKGGTVSAKHILVKEEEKCKEILAEIQSGAKTFEDAAMAYSTCPSSAQGGDLGTFGRGQMVPEFDGAVFAAEVNTVVGPVQTQFGYHLITVYDKTESVVPEFEEIKDQITAELLNDKQRSVFTETLGNLKAKYM